MAVFVTNTSIYVLDARKLPSPNVFNQRIECYDGRWNPRCRWQLLYEQHI